MCPVRDLPAKDLALLAHHRRCAVVGPPGRPPRPRDRPSINRVAAEFVASMQATLPSTVPTILRTASKLQVPFQGLLQPPGRLLKLKVPVAVFRDQQEGRLIRQSQSQAPGLPYDKVRLLAVKVVRQIPEHEHSHV